MQANDGTVTRDAVHNPSSNDEEEDSSLIAGTVKMDNNPAGGGCPGGAWVDIGTTTVASVNSFHYTSDPSTEYGPIFGPEFQSLYEFTKARIYSYGYRKTLLIRMLSAVPSCGRQHYN